MKDTMNKDIETYNALVRIINKAIHLKGSMYENGGVANQYYEPLEIIMDDLRELRDTIGDKL